MSFEHSREAFVGLSPAAKLHAPQNLVEKNIMSSTT